MLPRVAIFQHATNCHPGTLAGHLVADGITPTIIELDRGDEIPNLDRFDILMAMGGPMDVWQEDQYPWLKDEKAAIRAWVAEHDKPFLGVCLGRRCWPMRWEAKSARRGWRDLSARHHAQPGGT